MPGASRAIRSHSVHVKEVWPVLDMPEHLKEKVTRGGESWPPHTQGEFSPRGRPKWLPKSQDSALGWHTEEGHQANRLKRKLVRQLGSVGPTHGALADINERTAKGDPTCDMICTHTVTDRPI